MPALLTSTSSRPNDSTAAAQIAPRVALDVPDRRGGALAELLEQRLEPRVRRVRVRDDRRARLVEPPRDPGADVAARAGDDRDAAGQVEQAADRRRATPTRRRPYR